MTKSKGYKKRAVVFDTTCRDGSQGVDISPTVDDKLKITSTLVNLGVRYIEGGWPQPNGQNTEYFKRVTGVDTKGAKIVAFGSTRRKDTLPEEDAFLRALIEADTEVVCIFGKTWDLHVFEQLETTPGENLKMISDSVSYLKTHGKEVVYDAEHFFDGYRDNKKYAIRTLKAAQRAGADWIVLCDTNGGMVPHNIEKAVKRVRQIIQVPLGIHAHNDSDCAVANTLIAVQSGCTMVQGTINGYGERCGNANLVSVIPDLQKMGFKILKPEQLALLTEASRLVSEVLNVSHYDKQPFVGRYAFAHKGGVHLDAVLKGAPYEHIVPESVGNKRELVISKESGSKGVFAKAKELGIDLNGDRKKAQAVLAAMAEQEKRGYSYEDADGSFWLLVSKVMGTHRPSFATVMKEVRVLQYEDSPPIADAIVKIKIGRKRISEAAEGDGPVNALDLALRRAANGHLQGIEDIRLTDYKVRVLQSTEGTAAPVRVWIESTNGRETWGTIGVHENMVEASWEALVESIEYGLSKNQ